MAKTYTEKLRDPRWQKMRLEVMERENFACQGCLATDKTLNVHHCWYERGAEPWEYPDSAYQCLCEDCHEQAERARLQVSQLLFTLPPDVLEEVADSLDKILKDLSRLGFSEICLGEIIYFLACSSEPVIMACAKGKMLEAPCQTAS